MKRINIYLAGAIVGIGVLVFGAASFDTSAWSNNLRTGDNIVVEEGQTHQGSLYTAGKNIEINGTVDGDLYCAGETVVINGDVNGDILCAAMTIAINGDVEQDIRAAAQILSINSEVGGSVSALGVNVAVNDDGVIAGDLNGATQLMTVNGEVQQNLVVASLDLNVKGTIGGNIEAAVEEFDVASSATVGGDVTFTSTERHAVDENQVGGTVNFVPSESNELDAGDLFAGAAALVLPVILTAFIIALVAPRFLNRSHELLADKPLDTVLIGFAVVFGLPILATIMIFTLVLWPLGFILLSVWMLAMLLAGTFFAYWIGASLLRGQNNILIRLLGGLAILVILILVPLVNLMVILAMMVVGSGMLVSTLLRNYRRPSYRLDDSGSTTETRPVKKPKITPKK